MPREEIFLQSAPECKVNEYIVAELSVLHELSALAFAPSEERLVGEAMEKVTRLFQARYFAIVHGLSSQQRLLASSGLRSLAQAQAKIQASQNKQNQIIFLFNENSESQDIIYFEQSNPIEERSRRLYTIFAHRLEERLAAFRSQQLQRQTEQALRESEKRLYSIIQGFPKPTFVIGKDHKVLHWNRALEEFSGIDCKNMLGTKKTLASLLSIRKVLPGRHHCGWIVFFSTKPIRRKSEQVFFIGRCL